MNILNQVNAKRREVVAFLLSNGFALARESKHQIYVHVATGSTLPVPRHKTISPRVLNSIKKLVKE
jgi:predicted RNA binding protein YcfA (HicA-like mRNA interferase family)